MITWSGIYHILATPFREDGALDTAGLPRLIESALATGITGFTILGIAGEAHRLTDEERRRVVETVVNGARLFFIEQAERFNGACLEFFQKHRGA